MTENRVIPPNLETCLALNNYFDYRYIGDKVVGLHDYITTRGIVVGLSFSTYERRYCYQDREEASRALAAWKDVEGHPPGNWIKLKGTYKGEAVDYLNPNWSKA